jgi:hypothetical protein
MAFNPAAAASRDYVPVAVAAPVASSSIATEEDVVDFVTKLAEYVQGRLPSTTPATTLTQAQFDFVLSNFLVAVAHTGSSRRDTFPQKFALVVGRQTIKISVSEISKLPTCTLRRLMRYYANTVFRFALAHQIVFDWGVARGLHGVGWGFDAGEFITDTRFLPSDRDRLKAASARAISAAATLEDDDNRIDRTTRPGIGWDPAGHLDASHGFGRGSNSSRG